MKKIYAALVCLFLFAGMAHAQTNTVTGTVSDEAGNPLLGATVVLKGSTVGAATGNDGKFTLNIPGNSTLVVSLLGYMKTEIETGTKREVNVILKEDVNTLDEIVVVGYGTQRRGDVTGAIASIRGDELPKVANTTLAQALKGQIAGVSFTQTSSQPGAEVQLQIRGEMTGADPLIVIDGVPVRRMYEPDPELAYGKGSKESVLDNINPNDVQDIQVLKDASATSIYGSEAAGGVILITTKRGTEGRTQVTFNSSVTSQWIAERPPLLGPKDYMREVNRYRLQRYVYEQQYYPWGDRALPSEADLLAEFHAAYAAEPDKGFIFDPEAIDSFVGGTDWYDEVTRNGRIVQNDLSINGGNEKTKFRVSFGQMSNDGLVLKNDYNRMSGRINLDHTFNNWIRTGVSAAYTYLNSSDVALEGSGSTATLFSQARAFDPTMPVYDYNGNLSGTTMNPAAINPMSILDVTMDTKKDNLLTSAYLDIRPIEELSIMTTVGYDRKFASTGSYLSSQTQAGRDVGGIAKVNRSELWNTYYNVRATYSKTFCDVHSLSIMAGWEFQERGSQGLTGRNEGFPYDGMLYNNLELGTSERPQATSSSETSQALSVMARLNYSFKERYLLTANFRRDGSSNFAPNKQWGNFGGVAVAWRLKEEKWLKNVEWLYNLKLRAGYGVTGFAGSLTGIRTYYMPGGDADYYFDNRPTNGVRLSVIGNPNLSWESQYDLNLGLDFGFWGNRFGGTIDVYRRTIKDRIGTKALMSFQEVRQLHYNTQKVDRTNGMDLTLYAMPVNTQAFTWNTQFTLTFYRDLTIKRDPSAAIPIYEPDRPVRNDMYYRRSDGLLKPGEVNPGQLTTDRRAGEVKMLDLNGYLRDEMGEIVFDGNGRPSYSGMPDGRIDDADIVRIGNRTPIPISWNNSFRWKNFDLNINIYGKLHTWRGHDVMSNTSPESLMNGGNVSPYVMEQYSYDNLDATYPSYRFWQHDGVGYGDFFLQRSWFIRLDNISLGYTLPRRLTKGVLNSVRIYGAVKNVATITPYKGLDPEFDVYTYPSIRSFTFGLDINF